MATVDTTISSQFRDPRSRPWVARAFDVSKRFVQRKPLGAFGAFMLVFIVVVALFSPWIARDSLLETHVGDQLKGPSSEYWFGTDANGRDVYSRIVYGAQVAPWSAWGQSVSWPCFPSLWA